MMTTLTPIEAIALLEDGGYITPRCAACAYIYKDAVSVAARMTREPGLAPGQRPPAAPRRRAEGVMPLLPFAQCLGRNFSLRPNNDNTWPVEQMQVALLMDLREGSCAWSHWKRRPDQAAPVDPARDATTPAHQPRRTTEGGPLMRLQTFTGAWCT